MDYVLSVDGGNTKTIALVASLDGAILGAGRGGCGDIYYTPRGLSPPPIEPVAFANIEQAVRGALLAAQVQASDLACSVFSMAGADWPEDFAAIQQAMEARGFGRQIAVQNDALGVLHAGTSNDVGVSVVCGTGGATGARGPDGRVWHSSFWQDEIQGSHHLGSQTLTSVYRAELGIEPPTILREGVLRYYKLRSVEEVLHLFTSRQPQTVRDTGGLAPILLDAAEAGDHLARRIVLAHGRELGNYAVVAARRVGIEGQAFSLVLAGGVLRHPSTLLADAIVARVRETSPDVLPTRPRFEPIIGVLFTALEKVGVAVDSALIARLLPTLPPATLFDTSGRDED